MKYTDYRFNLLQSLFKHTINTSITCVNIYQNVNNKKIITNATCPDTQ